MSGKPRTDEQIEKDRAEIVALWVQGIPLGHIAQRLEIAPAIVTRDLAAVRKQWAASNIFNFNEQMMKELARLDAVEARAWQNMEVSEQPQKIHKRTKLDETKVITGNAGLPPSPFNTDEHLTGNNTTQQSKGVGNVNGRITRKEGNPQWLMVILKCIEQRCKLLRLIEPDMGAVTADVIKVYAGFDPDKV